MSSYVLPLARGTSDAMCLRMCGAELSHAASRQPAELSGLMDAMMPPYAEELCASC